MVSPKSTIFLDFGAWININYIKFSEERDPKSFPMCFMPEQCRNYSSFILGLSFHISSLAKRNERV
jgi:hypothetical protein